MGRRVRASGDARRQDGERQNGPRGGPANGFQHVSSSRPTDGGSGCTVKGRSPGSRLVAPLLLPRTIRPQWMTWRAACRLQLRGQPRHWPARMGEPHRVPVWPGLRRTADDRESCRGSREGAQGCAALRPTNRSIALRSRTCLMLGMRQDPPHAAATLAQSATTLIPLTAALFAVLPFSTDVYSDGDGRSRPRIRRRRRAACSAP